MDFYDGFIGAVVGGALALIGVLITNQSQKMNDLDSKSEWRKKLFELASKDVMTLNDVYLIRTTLRYKKHEKPYRTHSFKYMSNEIHTFCDNLIDFYAEKSIYELKESSETIVNFYDREKIRIYARYLLKNHWEVYSSKILFINNNFKLNQEHQIGKDTSALIADITKKELESIKNEIS